MSLFKKALVATAILGSISAQAATISSTPLSLSSEGVTYGVAPVVSTLTFDVVVDQKHPSASTITLTFDENVEFDTVACAGSVSQGVGSGTAFCGDIGFDYGTGSFTFDNVVVTDGDASKGAVDTISFDVNLGNPLIADSAFRVVIGNHNYDVGTPGTNTVFVSGASSVAYSSVNASDALIETGSGVIATETSQFGFAITSQLNAVIERDAQVDFINLDDTTFQADVFGYSITNDETLGLALTNVTANVVLVGNFADVGTFNATVNTTSTVNYSGTPETTTITIGLSDADLTAKTEKETLTLSDTGTVEMPVTGAVVAAAVVTGASNNVTALPTGGHVVASGVAAGEWILDATIINVPYFPVNFTSTSTSVHIANESSAAADVIVTAIDDNGTEYGPLDLGFDLNAKTVTKVSQSVIATLFGLTDPTKLSVTFNIDADEENVSAHAFTQNDNGRSEVSNSQLKGK